MLQYSFEKLNEYFVSRWGKARSLLGKGQQWGLIVEEHLEDAEARSVNQLAVPYVPERMIYGVRGTGGTNIGGESPGGCHYKVDLRSGEGTCMTP
jgi:hypothetical protein